MKTIVLLPILFISQGYSSGVPKAIFWIIENSWKPLFCWFLDPRLENHQIKPPGIGFVDFWSHGRKVIKSSLLGLVLSTSWANAEKSLNRVSWTRFVDFWSQGQKSIKSILLGLVLSYRFTIPAQYYIRKHFVIGSLFTGPPVCGSSAYSPSRRGTHEKCVYAKVFP